MSEASEAKSLEDLLPEGAEIKFGDETISRDDLLQKLRSADELEQANILARTEVGTLRDQINTQNGRLGELSDQVKGFTATQEQPTALEERDFQKEFDALDPLTEEYPDQVAQLRRDEMNHEREKNQRAMDSFKEEVRGEVKTSLNQSEGERRIHERNKASFEAVIDDPGKVPVELTPEERDQVLAARNSLYDLEGQYGQGDRDTKLFVWNDLATETALHMVPSVRNKLRAAATAEARNDGLRTGHRGRAAARSTPEPSRAGERGIESELVAQAKRFKGMSAAEQLEFARNNATFAKQYEDKNQDGRLDLAVEGLD